MLNQHAVSLSTTLAIVEYNHFLYQQPKSQMKRIELTRNEGQEEGLEYMAVRSDSKFMKSIQVKSQIATTIYSLPHARHKSRLSRLAVFATCTDEEPGLALV